MSDLIPYVPSSKEEPRRMVKPVSTDDVIPVHLFDDSAATRGIIMSFVYQFEDVLDPCKLHTSLSQLFQMQGWRKFSGRFMYQAGGGLEIHVPKECTAERPAVHFSHEGHSCSINEHDLASKLPKPNGKVTMFPGPRDYSSLALGPDTPRNMDDFVYSGTPQFCLHVRTFTDATIVGITFSHVSTDLGGLAAILDAWSLILKRKPEEVRPMAGYREDPFEGLWNPPPKAKHVLADKMLTGWRFKYWGIKSLYEASRCPDIQSRTLCVPKHVMDSVMREARSHLPGPNPPFISEGDVFTAIASQLLAHYEQPDPRREITTILALDPRSRAKSIVMQDAASVQNSPTHVYVSYPAEEILHQPIGKLARLVRDAIETQTTEEQIRAQAALSVQSMRDIKMPVIFGDKGMATQILTNWTKGHLAEKMDFGPAVVQQAATEQPAKATRGHPIYYQACDPTHTTVSAISSVLTVMQKDFGGNTWFSNTLPGEMWTGLISYLRQFE